MIEKAVTPAMYGVGILFISFSRFYVLSNIISGFEIRKRQIMNRQGTGSRDIPGPNNRKQGRAPTEKFHR